MEEEIRAQLLANQAMLNENTQNWEEKVCVHACANIETFIYANIQTTLNISVVQKKTLKAVHCRDRNQSLFYLSFLSSGRI